MSLRRLFGGGNVERVAEVVAPTVVEEFVAPTVVEQVVAPTVVEQVVAPRVVEQVVETVVPQRVEVVETVVAPQWAELHKDNVVKREVDMVKIYQQPDITVPVPEVHYQTTINQIPKIQKNVVREEVKVPVVKRVEMPRLFEEVIQEEVIVPAVQRLTREVPSVRTETERIVEYEDVFEPVALLPNERIIEKDIIEVKPPKIFANKTITNHVEEVIVEVPQVVTVPEIVAVPNVTVVEEFRDVVVPHKRHTERVAIVHQEEIRQKTVEVAQKHTVTNVNYVLKPSVTQRAPFNPVPLGELQRTLDMSNGTVAQLEQLKRDLEAEVAASLSENTQLKEAIAQERREKVALEVKLRISQARVVDQVVAPRVVEQVVAPRVVEQVVETVVPQPVVREVVETVVPQRVVKEVVETVVPQPVTVVPQPVVMPQPVMAVPQTIVKEVVDTVVAPQQTVLAPLAVAAPPLGSSTGWL